MGEPREVGQMGDCYYRLTEIGTVEYRYVEDDEWWAEPNHDTASMGVANDESRIQEDAHCHLASRGRLLENESRKMMPDADLPTLQQRVERVLDGVATIQGIKHWSPSKLAWGLKAMNDDFANDNEAEIARAASVWLRKVNR